MDSARAAVRGLMVYVLPGFLSPEECDAVGFSHTTAGAVNVTDSAAATKQVRRSRVAFLPGGHALEAHIGELLSRVNERFFHFDLDGAEPLQLAEYRESEHYGDHLDIGPGKASLRKLSASVQLSSPSDYDGGDLVIWGSGTVDKAKGTIAIFPSYLVHRVTPVTRGVRRSLVAWATGSRSYR